MKKINGFTLVELLAVIILLGLISAIGIPTVKNITRDAKQKGYEKQVATVLESAENWGTENTELLPKVSGSILVKMDTLKKEGFLENKEIINPVEKSEMNGCAEIIYNAEFNQYEYKYSKNCKSFFGISQLFVISTDLGVNSIASCVTNRTKCEPGTALAIKVNEQKTYKFYVVSDKNDRLTLIMNKNLGNKVAWVSKEDYGDNNAYGTLGKNDKGPITALEYLNALTSSWVNIPAIENYIYNNNLNGTTKKYGYQKLEIINGVEKIKSKDGNTITELEGIARARILTYEEATSPEIGCKNHTDTNSKDSCPSWITENLSSSNTTATPAATWLMSAEINVDHVYNIDNAKYIYINTVNDNRYTGVRPVIELSKLQPVPIY